MLIIGVALIFILKDSSFRNQFTRLPERKKILGSKSKKKKKGKLKFRYKISKATNINKSLKYVTSNALINIIRDGSNMELYMRNIKIYHNNMFVELSGTTPSETFQTYVKDYLVNLNNFIENLTIENFCRNIQMGINNPKKGLKSIKHNEDIKEFIIKFLYSFLSNPTLRVNEFNNIVLLGSAGIGKSHTANVIAYMLRKFSIIIDNKFYASSPADFTSKWKGEAERKLREAYLNVFGGVLFIDEIHNIYAGDSDTGNSQNKRVIGEFVNLLQLFSGYVIVIIAGYPGDTETQFLNVNEGTDRRFPLCNRFTFKDLSANQLTDFTVELLHNEDNVFITNQHANLIYTHYVNMINDFKYVKGNISTAISLGKNITDRTFQLISGSFSGDSGMTIINNVFKIYKDSLKEINIRRKEKVNYSLAESLLKLHHLENSDSS